LNSSATGVNPGVSDMTTKIALQITIYSPWQRVTDDLKRGLIINGETGRMEQIGVKSDAIEKCFYTDDLLKRADEVIDTVTIGYRQTHFLPSPDLPKIA
jgi:hypothetical protein